MPLRKSAADRKPALTPAAPASAGCLGQLKAVYSITRQRDPRLPLWLAGSALIPIAIGVVLGLLVGPVWLGAPILVLLGFVIAPNVFSRRVKRTAFAELEGKPGAAAGVIERMRGDWRVTPAVQGNREQDVVHRVVGRPGIVIIAEGHGRGPRDLLANEVRRVRRVAGDYPVRDIVVGN